MARVPRPKLNLKGIRQVESQAQAEVDAVARRKAAAAAGLVRVVPRPRPGRAARTYIETDGIEGAKAQARSHILERVIGS